MSWPLHPLRELTDKIGSGSTPRGGDGAYKATGTPLVRSMNVHDGTFKPDGLAFIDDEQARLLQNVTLHRGDVLINITGASVARSCILPESYSGGRVNQHVAIIRPKQKLDPAFLNYFLTAADTKRRLLNTAGGGATREALTKAQLEALEIPLPPLDEQKRIAAILDKADQLRQKRRQAIALLDSLTQSIFLEMFGDPNRAFEKVPLGSVCSTIRDGAHATPRYVESGIPFVTVKNITSGSLSFEGAKSVSQETHAELTKRVKPERGDILVSKDGTIGIPCLVETDEEFSIFVSVALLKPIRDLVNPAFLASQLGTEALQRQIRGYSKGVAIRHLHLTDFRRLQIILPGIEMQEKFVTRARHVQNERQQVRASLSQFDGLFSSLQHRAFSGQL